MEPPVRPITRDPTDDWPFDRPWPAPFRHCRRWWRRLGSAWRSRLYTLIYDPAYEFAVPGCPMDPLRAEKVLRFLQLEGLLARARLIRPRPPSLEALLRVHSPAYLESLTRPETLTRIFGLELDTRTAERCVEVHRLATGGTLAAVRQALAGAGPALNLSGGFHHAGAESGLGFCIFNDVAVAVAQARADGFDGRVLVVDLDVHDANGTRALFADDPSVHVYSIHAETWGDTRAAAATTLALCNDVTDQRYLATLQATLPDVLESFRPRLAIYLAGVDPAEDDALGPWSISPHGLLARDRYVVELLRARPAPVPLVGLLSGGYGNDAWRHTARTLAFLLAGRVIEPPDTDEITLARYHSIGDRLRAADFTREAPERAFELSTEDLLGVDPRLAPPPRFLGAFSPYGVELLLERFGLLARLRERGFDHVRVACDSSALTGETLRITSPDDAGALLVELRARRSGVPCPGLEVLVVEWLLLQNPRARFTPRRPQLPGQQHPGLGLLREWLGWLAALGELLHLDGVVFTPSYFHVARQSRKLVRFVDPVDEARMRACEELLAGATLAEAAAAVHAGRLRETLSGEVFAWKPCLMALPVSERLRARLTGPEYESAVHAARLGLSLRLS